MFSEIGANIADFFSPLTNFLTNDLPQLFTDVVSGVFSKVKKLFGFEDAESDDSELFSDDNPVSYTHLRAHET